MRRVDVIATRSDRPEWALERERQLLAMLADLDRDYRRSCEPISRELARLDALFPVNFIMIDKEDPL